MIRYLLILSIFFFSCSKEEAVLENPYQLELSWVGQGYGLGTKDLLWTKKVDLNNENLESTVSIEGNGLEGVALFAVTGKINNSFNGEFEFSYKTEPFKPPKC